MPCARHVAYNLPMRIRNTSDTPNKSLFRATIADTYDVCDTLSINAFILDRKIPKEREKKCWVRSVAGDSLGLMAHQALVAVEQTLGKDRGRNRIRRNTTDSKKEMRVYLFPSPSPDSRKCNDR